MSKSKWTLSKKLLEDTLMNPSQFSKKGLFLEPKEFAGKVIFDNNNCRIESGNRVCDKIYSNHTVTSGQRDTVITPHAKVNFHTHPLHCYVDAEVVWGWPSGEDMAQCIRFAQDGNIYHIIFAIEGTYIITVNKNIELTSDTIECIETIFKLTHKYRWYKNMENQESLRLMFQKFISISGIKPKGQNMAELWVNFVNDFRLGHCEYYSSIKIPTKLKSTRVFKVYMIKNESIQYNKDPSVVYNYFQRVKNNNDLKQLIKMPKSITVTL